MTAADAARTATARYAQGPLLGAIAVAAGWHLANDLTGTLTVWSQYSSPMIGGLVWLMFTAVGMASAANLLRPTHRRAVLPVTGVAVLLSADIIQLVVCPPSLLFHVGDWAWSNFGWFAMLLLWRWPLRLLFAAMGANAIVALTVLLLTQDMDRVNLARFATIVFSAYAIELGVAWGGRVLEDRAGQANRAASEQSEIVTAQIAAERVHADRQRRYREIGPAIRQLLAELAAEQLDPSDPAAHRRCAIEASRLRRLIAEHYDLPSPIVTELRSCADIAERRDVEVSLDIAGAPPSVPPATRRALTEGPLNVLAAAQVWARITVIWSAEEREMEVSVVADTDRKQAISPPAETTDVQLFWAQEGDTLWVRTLWHRQ